MSPLLSFHNSPYFVASDATIGSPSWTTVRGILLFVLFCIFHSSDERNIISRDLIFPSTVNYFLVGLTGIRPLYAKKVLSVVLSFRSFFLNNFNETKGENGFQRGGSSSEDVFQWKPEVPIRSGIY